MKHVIGRVRQPSQELEDHARRGEDDSSPTHGASKDPRDSRLVMAPSAYHAIKGRTASGGNGAQN